MSLDEPALSLIGTIYDAAIDERQWRHVMEKLLAATDCQGATFCILDSSERPRLPTFETVNFDPVFIQEYLDQMVPHDPNIQYLVSHPGQRIYHDATFITEAEKDRHMYYDWHGRHSDTRHRLLGIINPVPRIQSGITLHRTRGRGDFEPQTVERFTALFGHIERALEIGFRLGTLGCWEQVSLDLLDRNPLAIVLLDEGGRVILANRAARALGAARDGLVLTRDGLALLRAPDDRRLQQLIGAALNTAAGTGASAGGAISALRPSGKRPFSILVSPLSGSSFAMTKLRPAACIVIADPEQREPIPVERLRELFGLTPAEARLAARLAAGEELRAAADALGIRYQTARTQLIAIFRKTQTQRQGELIKLLLTAVPQLAN
jgi:DNA-binding CsgD family transcriptional regulator